MPDAVVTPVTRGPLPLVPTDRPQMDVSRAGDRCDPPPAPGLLQSEQRAGTSVFGLCRR